MYMMMRRKQWTIASARQQLPALIGSAAREPQRVYRRKTLVAAVVSPEVVAQLEKASRPKLAGAFAQLRELCRDEQYELPPPSRSDRTTTVRRRGR